MVEQSYCVNGILLLSVDWAPAGSERDIELSTEDGMLDYNPTHQPARLAGITLVAPMQ